MPGSLLLALARLVVNAETVSRLVEPTIADLRREFADSGTSRIGRMTALLSGYAALWRVMGAVSLRATLRAFHPVEFDLRSFVYHAPWVPLGLFLVVFMWQLLAWSLIPMALAWLLFAATVRRWNTRHPARLAVPKRVVEPASLGINVALVPVSGNAGGLIFMTGSLAILMLGLPVLAVFLTLAALSGVAVAAALFAWHAVTGHTPQPGSPLGRLAR